MLGLAPATFLLFPFLLVGVLGTVLADMAGGAIDRGTAGLILWALAGAVGIMALWVVVLNDGAAGLNQATRLALTVGLLLGIASGARWLWEMSKSVHKYEATTWAVWLVLLGGPLLVATLRLVQLWKSPQNDAT